MLPNHVWPLSSSGWHAHVPVTFTHQCRRYETGFNGFGGSNFSTAAQYTAFANTTMLQRLSALISNGTANGGNAPLIGEWGLAGAHFVSQRMHAHDKAANMRNIPLHGSLAWHCSMKRAAESILLR